MLASKPGLSPLRAWPYITTNRVLTLDAGTGSQETVKVLAVGPATFDALFGQNHAGGVTVQATEDVLLGPLITEASAQLLEMTGRIAPGVIPTVSPFLAPVAYDEWYDGTPNVLFLRQWPIVGVQLVEMNGIAVPLSTSYYSNGYLIAPDLSHLIYAAVPRLSSGPVTFIPIHGRLEGGRRRGS